MSESNEKQINTEEINEVDSKAAREEQQRKAEKRTSMMYRVIAVAFVIVAAITLIWRSNIIAKTATALDIDGEKYTSTEVTFYYRLLYQNFYSNNYMWASAMGLDASIPLDSQTINETGASFLGCEAGITWHEYFLGLTLQQMAIIQDTLAAAEAEGFAFDEAALEAEQALTMEYLAQTAASNATTVSEYLKSSFGDTMTEKIYSEHTMRLARYNAYTSAYEASLTYTDAELEAAYDADPLSYDVASYEYVSISGAAETTTDADGNTVEATEEESAAALEAAKATAEEILAAYKDGGDLENLAEKHGGSYIEEDAGSYYDTVLTNWLFDDSRKAGDVEILENGTTIYVVVFHDRYRDETETIDVRHILIQPAAGEKVEGDEGYEEEQEQLLADAKAQAEELLAQWKAGDATEESFAALANEHSTDAGSNTVGGLYEAVMPNTMVAEFDDWCFDASRKAGDTGIVYGESTGYQGYHIMYFAGKNLPIWKYNVDQTLRSEDYSTWAASFGTETPIETKSLGIQFVG